MQAICWYWLGGVSPGKPGAEEKQFNQSGCVYESLLGFVLSGCFWDDFCQEWGNSPGAACTEQCASVTPDFPCTKLHFYPPITLLLVQNKIFEVHAEDLQSSLYLLEPQQQTKQCCATCLQQDCLICHLCVTPLVLRISVLKTTS